LHWFGAFLVKLPKQSTFRQTSVLYSTIKSTLRATFCGIDQPGGKCAIIRAHQLMRPEGPRHFLLATPSADTSAETSAKRPLVILLHGAGSSAAQLLGQAFPPSPLSVWLEIAEREQLLVAAPDGSKRRGETSWNDSFAGIARNPRTDDTGFIGAIIDRAIAEHGADPLRVYVMGVSKGGMMSYRVATEIGPRLAGFAAVLATMPVESNCGWPKAALSALIIAGTGDPFIPYQGGKSRYTLGFTAPALSAPDSAEVWRTLAGLPEQAAISQAPARAPAAPTRVRRQLWGADPGGLQVGLLTIVKGGHAEPSIRKRYPTLFNLLPGLQNGDIEVAEEAWAFFRHKQSGLSA
jgi:polyhydroxybutyrate depolymerase